MKESIQQAFIYVIGNLYNLDIGSQFIRCKEANDQFSSLLLSVIEGLSKCPIRRKQPFAFDPLVRRLFDVEAAPTCDKVSQCCPRLCNALHLATLQPSPTKSLEIQKKPAQRTQNGSQSPVLKCTLILVTEWWLANFSDVTLANEMKNMSTTH